MWKHRNYEAVKPEGKSTCIRPNQIKDLDRGHSSDLSGGLVYADPMDRSINLVSSTQIQTLIRRLLSGKQIQRLIIPGGWIPWGLCCSSSGDLLVIMDTNDDKQRKVVRYSGFTETQSI